MTGPDGDRKRSPFGRSQFDVKPSKIYVGRLSRNVKKEHVQEIFANFGTIKHVELPPNMIHQHLTRGFAYVEYEKAEEAEKAIKYMNGGQVDGQKIYVSVAMGPKKHFPKPKRNWRSKRSPRNYRRGGRGRSPNRFRDRSPKRSRSPRRASRTPPRRRRFSSSRSRSSSR